MVTTEKRTFIQNHVQYVHAWIKQRHLNPLIKNNFGEKLLSYYNYVCSTHYPEHLFNRKEGLRCSNFRIKGLHINSRKKISLELIKTGKVHLINAKNQPDYIPESIKLLPKMANIWYKIFSDTMDENPGHDPILDKILQLNENALSIETPIWTSTRKALKTNQLHFSSYTCMCDEIVTGHIDLIMYDPTDQSVVVCDYKPENHFLHSLAQVATYGLIMKQILKYDKVKCVSFSKEKAWVYDPEILRTTIPKYLKAYGNPNLCWTDLIFTL